MEMLQEVGMCKGIENYSAVLSGRAPGSTPTTLLDYFPDDFLLMVDESQDVYKRQGGCFQPPAAAELTFLPPVVRTSLRFPGHSA